MSTHIDNNVVSQLGLGQQTEKKKTELGQGDFMRLMTSQLSNQDPLKPMDNGDFLSQMAQFSTSSGIQTLNDSFSQLSNSLYSSQALQASSLIGRTVQLPGNTAYMEKQGGFNGALELPVSSSEVQVTISDLGGNVVKQINLGAQESGQVGFNWDGTGSDGEALMPGKYNVTAQAVIDGKDQALNTVIEAKVESVTLGSGSSGLMVNLAGLGAAAFNEVKQIK
ncbi:MAG: flagellar hook assembly protein FlgD [Gammaproteobacteria bacterium]|nr:flagellar hook assembly protein FlgD [Gammaproteobacteria bacterium]